MIELKYGACSTIGPLSLLFPTVDFMCSLCCSVESEASSVCILCDALTWVSIKSVSRSSWSC